MRWYSRDQVSLVTVKWPVHELIHVEFTGMKVHIRCWVMHFVSFFFKTNEDSTVQELYLI